MLRKGLGGFLGTWHRLCVRLDGFTRKKWIPVAGCREIPLAPDGSFGHFSGNQGRKNPCFE